jgi:uncharacterized protein (DUF1501 family)
MTMELCEFNPSRRAILGSAGALFGWAFMPKFAFAAGNRDARLVVVVLRGALDGLAAVGPAGDPDYVGLHGSLALSASGAMPGFALDGFFVLHPSMPNFARLYKAGQASVVHAVSTSYRDRSHFDGQDVLESGQPGPGLTKSGWLNRVVAALPRGERIQPRGALGVGAIPPLVVRGSAPILGWAPAALPPAGDDLARRALELYRHTDPALGNALAAGLDAEGIAMAQGMSKMKPGGGPSDPNGMRQAAEGAARLIAAPDGPRIAALAFEGWDTHANEGGAAANGQLATRLRGLDGAIAAFETVLGDAWRDTALMVVTEFGRTARINGTAGTDHGQGTVAFLAGGAIRGGRVIADWPGLSTAALYEGRDLKPTTDLRSIAKGVIADLFGVSPAVLARDIFPDSGAVKPAQGLVA